MDPKKPYLSKTLWMAAIVAVCALIPGAGEFVSKNIELVGIVVGAIFGGLRLITKGKIGSIE
jgi:hypothetical protein